MTGRVLVVDDSLTVRMDLIEALEAAELAVRGCSSVAAAREALAQAPADVIVLDVMLPDGNGIELAREIRTSLAPAAAILMLSSEAEVRDRVRALQTGADEYVGKPYDRTYVVARVRELSRRAGAVFAPSESKVLIIDDSLTYREQLRAALEEAGYRAIVATSGEEGLRLAADQRPAAVLVDGVLPGIDGPTVIRRIRLDAALRSTPCILLTAADDSAGELRALDAGADAFVRKDGDLAVVLARLAVAMRRDLSDEPVGASLLGPHRVLVVDSDGTGAELLSGMHSEGFDVALARSGEQALELLAVQPVDCILLARRMSGIDGHETCRRVKAAPMLRDVPLLLFDADDSREAALDALAAGADDYVATSNGATVLHARVRAQLRRKQFEDEKRRTREQLLRTEFAAAEARAARELAEARAALAEELQRQNEELDAFSYSVAHDLRAPLRAIGGFSRALGEDYQLDPTGQDYLTRIETNVRRMGSMIDDLLKLAQVGRASMRRQSVDLSAEARTIIARLREASPQREVDVRVTDQLVVDADPGLVRALLENLLSNAWKFTGRRPHALIEVGALQRDGARVFYVRDNGAGFDPQHAAKLFRAFQRLHRYEEFEGTGVGLATVHRIVSRHDGRVWAEASPGQGATFYFTL